MNALPIFFFKHSNQLCSDLENVGCVSRKSNIITLPKLSNKELYLAFLLGFYDGDGTQHQIKITCGSRNFLEQIKEMFQLPFKIHFEEHDNYIDINRKIHGCGYSMCFGSILFNEMMGNYEDSLPPETQSFLH